MFRSLRLTTASPAGSTRGSNLFATIDFASCEAMDCQVNRAFTPVFAGYAGNDPIVNSSGRNSLEMQGRAQGGAQWSG
jgi:hypothetical protein